MDPANLHVREQLTRLSRWQGEGWAPPLHLDICPTNRCNLHCLFCPNATLRPMDPETIAVEITDERWLQIVEDGLSLGVLNWRIVGGGEPMLRGNLVVSLVETIKAHSALTTCDVHTNGTLFTGDSIRGLVKAGLDLLTVSLDGVSADVHDKLRAVPGSFRRTVRALERFRDIKARLGKEKPLIRIHMVVCSLNAHQVEEMPSLAADFGVSIVNFAPVKDYEAQKTGFESLALTEDDIEGLRDKAEDIFRIAREKGLRISKDEEILPGGDRRVLCLPDLPALADTKESLEDDAIATLSRPMPRCLEPWYVLMVNADGSVSPCCVGGNDRGDFSFRPSLRNASISDVWKSEFMGTVRERVYHDQPLGLCDGCPIAHKNPTRKIVAVLESRHGARWSPL